MCGSQHLSASFYMWLQVWFGVLNVPNAVFDTRNVMKMPWTFNNKKIWLSELWHDGYCMSLWYLKSYGSQRSNHSHSPYTFLSGLHCPIKKIWGLETAGVKGGEEMRCEWEKERVSFESVSAHLIVCNLCPAVSCLSNRMSSMRKWNYGQMLSTSSMLGVLCVCLYVRERWWLVGASWLWTMSSKQTHSCRASVMRPIYSSPLSAGRHAVPHFRFYCIASVSPSRGARRGSVTTAVIWPGKVKFTLWQAIAKSWDVKLGCVLRPFHVWVATFWSERKVSHCRFHTV